jgi:hypothetical protein
MRKVSLILLISLSLSLSLFLFLQAGDKDKGGAKTIEGTLVDTKCYAMGAFVTNDHVDMKGNKLPNCATACAAMGIPVAVLDKDKKVHVLASPANGYAQWMAKEVRIKGMYGKHAKVFIPSHIEVKEKGKWVKKDLPGAMM